jgi:hypothetical protein
MDTDGPNLAPHLSRKQAQVVVALAKQISAGETNAREVLLRRIATGEVDEVLEAVGLEIQSDAAIEHEPGWRLMSDLVERDWPAMPTALREPEAFTETTYPLLVGDVAHLYVAVSKATRSGPPRDQAIRTRRPKGPPPPSSSSIRRLASASGAPRIGPGNYRVFFARHVLYIAFLHLAHYTPALLEETRRHARLLWSPYEAAVILIEDAAHPAAAASALHLMEQHLGVPESLEPLEHWSDAEGSETEEEAWYRTQRSAPEPLTERER